MGLIRETLCIFSIDVVFCDDIDCRLVWSLSSSYQYPINYIRGGEAGGGYDCSCNTHINRNYFNIIIKFWGGPKRS